jgi:long-chain fatty acid transport protein
MKLTQCKQCWFGVLALALFGPVTVLAVGLRLPNQDPEAIGRANAFVATADNPSAIYYNPAGITQLEGQNIHAGAYFLSTGVDYESSTGTAHTKSDFNAVPQLYYVYSPEKLPLSFGLGVYVPYGLALEWQGNSPFRTAAEKGDLLYLTVNPVVAWKVLPTLSIAIGPTINYSKATLERGIGFLPNDRFKLTGDGFDYGFNAGVLWQPHPMWSFGLNYHYLTTVKYEGTAETTPSPPLPASTSASTEIRFPQYIVGGISFRPTENWNIEFDLDWTDWESLNSLVIKGTAFGNQIFPFNYRSSFMYEFGVTRKFSNGWYASVGYFYSENSSPDKDFNPIVPDSDLHLGCIGFGHKGKHWDWAAAYQFGYNPGREVKNDESFPQANGTYHILNHAFNLSATFKF